MTMTQYGGQNGRIRREARMNVRESLDRFKNSLSLSDYLIDFAPNVRDNYNLNDIGVLLYNPSRQADITSVINQKALSTTRNIAISLSFTWFLYDFESIEPSVCERLTGLYIFSALNMSKEPIEDFIKRCPNIKSLTLAYLDVATPVFLQNLFVKGLLPNLEYLEVGNCSDAGIAAMASAPMLKEIVFRFRDHLITNNAFKRLVMNGGAQNLWRINGSAASANSRHLTKNYLKAILPCFKLKGCDTSGLKGMEIGPQVSGSIELPIVRITFPLHPALAAPSEKPSLAAPSEKPSPVTLLMSSPISTPIAPKKSREKVKKKKSISKKKMAVKRSPLGEMKATNVSNQGIANKRKTAKPRSTRKQMQLENKTVAMLKTDLRAKGLKVSGRKAELVERLLAA